MRHCVFHVASRVNDFYIIYVLTYRNALNANAKKTPPAKQKYFEWQLRLPHGLHLVQMAQISTANSFTASSNPLASLRDGHYSQWHGPSWPGPRQIQRPHMAANSLR